MNQLNLTILFVCATVASSRRFQFAVASQADPGDAVSAFRQQCQCKECVLIVGSLLEGIRKAGYLAESNWDGSVLSAKLNQDHLYGEIASGSRIATFLSLDKKLTFRLQTSGDETHVLFEGVHTEPSEQGLGLYEAFMDAAGLDRRSAATDDSSLKKETKAAFAYLQANFWKKRKIREQSGKISKVLLTTYDHWYIRNAPGVDFGEVLYSMVTLIPQTITSLVFFKDTKGYSRVYATSIAYPTSDTRYDEYNLLKKSQKMAATSFLNGASMMDLAERWFRSGMNVAKMISYGNDHIRPAMQRAGLSAADPDAIGNLFSFCEGTVEGHDPTCTGSTPGRVGWSPSKHYAMTTNAMQ